MQRGVDVLAAFVNVRPGIAEDSRYVQIPLRIRLTLCFADFCVKRRVRLYTLAVEVHCIRELAHDAVEFGYASVMLPWLLHGFHGCFMHV